MNQRGHRRDGSNEFTLARLKEAMRDNGVGRLYAKRLAENDNSKNQVYLGPDLSSLNILPVHGIVQDPQKSEVLKAPLEFLWLDDHGNVSNAPGAQLILYPQYPEVRLSGFLRGCVGPPSELMTIRQQGRVLFLGITQSGKIIGFVASPESKLGREFEELGDLQEIGVFLEIPVQGLDPRNALLAELKRVHLLNWIDSKRLKADGTIANCNSSNCGGYTLEAELGVRPNGFSEPDFLGWEIKQHGVENFERPESGTPITLMTPEPTAGYYKDQGVDRFIREFGYRDKIRPDRLNFSGRHFANKVCGATGLKLVLTGYDQSTGRIDDLNGGLSLLTPEREPAATWQYTDIMRHWNRKHAQAAYVPAMKRTDPRLSYKFGPIIRMAEGTDFLLFLKAVSLGKLYYDPGIKMENVSATHPTIKRRSQFRMASGDISALYRKVERVDLTE
jgi:hypothetical protein